MNSAKLLLETLRMADGGKVTCEVATPDGNRLTSIIENSFFEEFASPAHANNTQRQLRIIQDNLGYLETEAQRLWQQGQQALVIR